MKYIKDILKGMLIGVASHSGSEWRNHGGFLMGIYDDIIYCVTHLFSQLKKSLKILSPYIIGMAVGIVGFAYIIGFLLEHYGFQTKMAFIGLILGGLPLLLGKVKGKKKGISHVIVFLVFFLSIILMQYFGGEGKEVTLTVGIIPAILLFIVGVTHLQQWLPWCERVYDAHDPWLLQPNPLSSQRFYERACKGTVAYDFAVMWIIDSIRTWRCDRYFCYC